MYDTESWMGQFWSEDRDINWDRTRVKSVLSKNIIEPEQFSYQNSYSRFDCIQVLNKREIILWLNVTAVIVYPNRYQEIYSIFSAMIATLIARRNHFIVCLSVCLSVRLSVCLSICPSVCMYGYTWILICFISICMILKKYEEEIVRIYKVFNIIIILMGWWC